MKISRILFFLICLIVFPVMTGCNAEKQMTQRRNLMMPHKDELPRNSKYTGIKKRKNLKSKKRKKKKRRRYSWIDYFNKEQNLRA